MTDVGDVDEALLRLCAQLRLELIRVLGSGGFGVVYLVRQASLDRLCALKVLRNVAVGNTELEERFTNEGRIAARLEHPNLVTVYDQGVLEDIRWILMQYVDGEDLGKLIARVGPLDPVRALGLLHQAAAALDVVHAAGLLHRDIKPDNLLIRTSNGREICLVTDFGIAALTQETQRFTSHSDILGSVLYMAPERWLGELGTPETDVYALACVLFECLTGRPPFHKDGPPVVYGHAHLEEPVPRLTDVAKTLPDALNGVMERALAKAPAERYARAGDFVAAAEQGMTVPVAGVASRTATVRDQPAQAQSMSAVTQTGAPPQTGAPVQTTPPTQTAPPTQSPPPGPGARRRRTAWLAGGGVLVVVVVVLVLLLLLSGGSSKKNSASPGSSGSPQPVASNTTSVSPSSAGQTTAGGSVQRQGELTLKDGDSAILESSQPDWQVQTGCDDNCELYLRFGSLTSGFDFGDLATVPSATTPSLAVCRAATNYVKGLSQQSLPVAANVCVRTASKHYALLTVKKTTSSPSDALASITFDVTVWK